MKVLYLHQYFKFPHERGSTRSYDLSKGLITKGYEVAVITATSNEKYKNSEKWTVVNKHGIEVHYIYLPFGNDHSFLKRVKGFFIFMIACSSRLLKLKGDVVIATSTPLTIGIPALVKKWLHRTPFIFEVRDVWPEAVIAIGAIRNKLLQRILYKLEKLIYKNARFIVPLSTDMKASIIKRYPTYASKIKFVITNISEIDRFQRTGLNKNIVFENIGFQPRFTVLYAGTFGQVNGIHKFVELASLTWQIDNQLIYILMGVGAKKEEVIQLAKSNKLLNKNIFVMDSISKDELPDWYASVSMGSSFVIDIKELWANSANKFFDTLAAGKPILINHEGWQANRIREENIGYVLPNELDENSALDFVNYTKGLEKYKTQCVSALDLAKKEYSLEVAVEKYNKILRSM